MLQALKNQKNSKKQGDVGLGVAIAWFTMTGDTVSIPITDSQDYDLIIDIDDKLCRVQVKTTTYKRGNTYVANVKVCGGNRSGNNFKYFDNTKVDYLFIVDGDGEKYFIPSEVIDCKSSINLGAQYEKYKL